MWMASAPLEYDDNFPVSLRLIDWHHACRLLMLTREETSGSHPFKGAVGYAKIRRFDNTLAQPKLLRDRSVRKHNEKVIKENNCITMTNDINRSEVVVNGIHSLH